MGLGTVRSIVGLIVSASAIVSSQGQTFSRLFESTQLPGTEWNPSAIELPGGDYVVAMQSNSETNSEYVFARLNPSGSIRSQRSFLEFPSAEERLGLYNWKLGQDQSIFAQGFRRTRLDPVTELDPVIAKLDLDGQPLWVKTITSDLVEPGFGLSYQPLAAGTVACVLGKQVVFLSAAGEVEVSYYLPLPDLATNGVAVDIAPSPSGTGIVLLWETANTSMEPNNGDPEFYLLQLERDGSIPWQKAYRTALAANVRELARATNGELYVVFWDDSTLLPTGIGVVKLDVVGNVLWAKRVDDPYPGYGDAAWVSDASATADGGIAVLCQSRITSGGGSADDTWLISLGPTGSTKWYRHIGEWLGENIPGTVRGTADGGVVVASRPDILPGIEHAGRALITRLDWAGFNATSICSHIRPTTSGITQTTATAGPLFVVSQPVGAATAPYQLLIDGSYGIRETLECSGLPTEVAAPGALQPLRFANRDELVWEPAAASNSSTFNVLRGTAATLPSNSGGGCIASGLAVSRHLDMLQPNLGESLTYLVQGRNSVGTGILGRRSSGAARTSNAPCP